LPTLSKLRKDIKPMNELVHQLIQINTLRIPRNEVNQDEMGQMANFIDREDTEFCYLHCTHRLYQATSAPELANLEKSLETQLPFHLKQLLQTTNGAEFFITPNWGFPDERVVRYHVFNTEEILRTNRELLKQFRSMLGDDPDFQDVHSLNYVAFCDAHDDNYLAILLDKQMYGSVFFLNNEYLYRPYTEQDSDLYYTVAGSLEEWFGRLLLSSGWDGFYES